MKKLLVFVLMMAVGASVFADMNDDYRVYREEAAAILAAVENSPIGEFTLNEMREVALDLSIPFQKMQLPATTCCRTSYNSRVWTIIMIPALASMRCGRIKVLSICCQPWEL